MWSEYKGFTRAKIGSDMHVMADLPGHFNIAALFEGVLCLKPERLGLGQMGDRIYDNSEGTAEELPGDILCTPATKREITRRTYSNTNSASFSFLRSSIYFTPSGTASDSATILSAKSSEVHQHILFLAIYAQCYPFNKLLTFTDTTTSHDKRQHPYY